MKRIRSLLQIVLAASVLTACADNGPVGPQPPAGALKFKDIGAGYYHTCGLTTQGITYCWGHNVLGTLGDGTREQRTLPTRVFGGPTFVDIDVGAGHTCGLSEAGEAWCWGQNDEGQVGDGTFIPRDRPVKVTGNLIFKSVTAGHAHSCGVIADGTAYCWGDDSRGQLGDSATGKSARPVKVQSNEPFKVVIAGYYQTCGLTTTNRAFCWGLNDNGQFDSKTYQSISAGDRFGCGISSGVVTCWGANRNGELAAPASLTSVYAARGASTVGGAEPYGCGINSEMHAVCWGGAIRALRTAGPGNAIDDRIVFTQLAVGSQHMCGLSASGYAYCGGANYNGQLGIGTLVDSPTLQPVNGPLN